MSYKLMKKEDINLYLKELTKVIRKNQRNIIVSIKKQLKYCFFMCDGHAIYLEGESPE